MIHVFSDPLDAFIVNYIPSFSGALQYFNDFIDWVIDFFGWLVSWFNIPYVVVDFACLLMIADISIRFLANVIKIAVAWWDKLKL